MVPLSSDLRSLYHHQCHSCHQDMLRWEKYLFISLPMMVILSWPNLNQVKILTRTITLTGRGSVFMDKPSVPRAQNPTSSTEGVCRKKCSWTGQLLHQWSLCWVDPGTTFTGSSLDYPWPGQQAILPGWRLYFIIYI